MSDKMRFKEVKANRQKWIDFLREDGRKKSIGYLDRGNGKRSCLGHACYVLDVPKAVINEGFAYGAREEELRAPGELVKMLGLRDKHGLFQDKIKVKSGLHDFSKEVYTLTGLNDHTSYTPKMIADFIEEHYDSVFLSKREYKERYGTNV